MKFLVLPLVLVLLAGARAEPGLAQARPIDGPGRYCSDGSFGAVLCLRAQHKAFDLCQALRDTARHHFLDEGFFARLIWQDSRFDLGKISAAKLVAQPVLNSDKPGLGTITDHLNPLQIIEKTGRYLAYLKQEDGNVGLAAMAYDAGERGAFGFMAGNVKLRQRSVEFVHLVTGLSADRWRNDPPEAHDFSLSQDVPFMQACLDLTRGAQLEPPGSNTSHWAVALGHSASLSGARLQHQRDTKLCRDDVANEQVDFIPAQHRFPGRRALWVAQVAQPGQGEALDYCAALHVQGCPCRVVMNR